MTKDNYRDLLTPLLTAGGGQGFCVNLSVDTSSLDIMELCRELGALYIDTVVEPWLGFYFDPQARTGGALELRAARDHRSPARRKRPGGDHRGLLLRRQSRHGVLVRQAGAAQCRRRYSASSSRSRRRARNGRASTQQRRRQGHPYRRARHPARQATRSRMDVFVNTWSVEGFVSEGMQPAELGWGTHEKWMPANARKHKTGCGAAIYLMQPGANTRVRSWTPTAQAQYGFLVTHNEFDLDRRLLHAAATAARSSTGRPATTPITRATTRCCRCTSCSAAPASGRSTSTSSTRHEIVDGIDELGVLLYGHEKNAYWYGSQLSIEETRDARALPERHRPAGHLGGARRHGLGAGKSRTPASSRPTRWISAAASRCRRPISAR